MINIDSKRRKNIGLSRFATFVVKHLYDVNWTMVSASCEVTGVLYKHDRVTRAQDHGDPDYDISIFNFLSELFTTNEQIGFLLINEIISQTKLSTEQEAELKEILKFFDNSNIDSFLVPRSSLEDNIKFINLISFPDDFYKRLIEEINFQYMSKHSISLSILLRKLFENLIIDILRKKYNKSELNIYFDISKSRFHDFSILLKNLETKKQEFHYVTQNLDSKFIRELSKYRDVGNSSAHSIDVNINIDDFTLKRDDINFKVQFLIRLLNNI